jgi:uncharacterized protein
MSFRILSLDGGGSWSLTQIMTLIDLYRSGGSLLTGHHVLRDFDLVVANSGGSIVLGGLIKDLPLTDIQLIFEDKAFRQSVFAAEKGWRNLAMSVMRGGGGVRPRYSARRKFEGLRGMLNSNAGEPAIGDITLDALKTRTKLPTELMITAFDYDRQREVFFRSNTRSRAASFGTPAIATLAEAVHASTNAPVAYFDAPAAVSRGRRCWDGALGGYNNPVLAGIAEALANGIAPQAIEVLSIGSGSVILPQAGGNEDSATAKLVQQRARPSMAGDLRKLADSILDDPPDSVSLVAHLVLGHAVSSDGAHPTSDGRLVRMNPLVQPIRVANSWVRPAGLAEAEDGSDEFVRLRELGIDVVADDDIALIKKFCTLWHNDAVVNQPIRANSDTLECEIGQRWYNEAKAQWLALTQSRAKQPAAASGGAGAGGAATAWPSAPARLSASKMG